MESTGSPVTLISTSLDIAPPTPVMVLVRLALLVSNVPSGKSLATVAVTANVTGTPTSKLGKVQVIFWPETVPAVLDASIASFEGSRSDTVTLVASASPTFSAVM